MTLWLYERAGRRQAVTFKGRNVATILQNAANWLNYRATSSIAVYDVGFGYDQDGVEFILYVGAWPSDAATPDAVDYSTAC